MKELQENSRLADLSEALAAAVSRAGRSVMRVEARRRGNSSGIAWSADGLLVTAHHTVQRDEDLRVGLPGGEIVPAILVGRDPGTDVAVLRASGATLEPPAWAGAAAEAGGPEAGAGAISELRVGHLVLSVGRHDEHAQTSLGIVAKKDGAWRTRTGGTIDTYLETDIGVYPGFSGSALVDAAGRVHGMNTSWFAGRASLTLLHETLARAVGALLEHGRVRRGFLGVGAHPVRLPSAPAEELGRRTGLLVAGVEPGSPADRAGMLVGDLIVTLDGEPTPNVDELMFLLTGERVGRPVPLRIVRGGRLDDLSVTLAERRGSGGE